MVINGNSGQNTLALFGLGKSNTADKIAEIARIAAAMADAKAAAAAKAKPQGTVITENNLPPPGYPTDAELRVQQAHWDAATAETQAFFASRDYAMFVAEDRLGRIRTDVASVNNLNTKLEMRKVELEETFPNGDSANPDYMKLVEHIKTREAELVKVLDGLGTADSSLRERFSLSKSAFSQGDDGKYKTNSLELYHPEFGKIASIDESKKITFFYKDGTNYSI